MTPDVPSKRFRVLVVDDDSDIHDVMRLILDQVFVSKSKSAETNKTGSQDEALNTERTRFEINSAFQGEEAVAMVDAARKTGHPYSVAFVDVRMPPGWDGVETMIRIWQASPEMQLILCTAYSDYTFEDLTSKFGFRDNLLILKKPFDRVEVLQLAHALANKWKLTQDAATRMQELDRTVRQRTQELQTTCEQLKHEIHERTQTEERFARAFQSCPVPMMIRTVQDERFVEVNDSFLKVAGRERDEVIGRTELELELWADPNERSLLNKALNEGNRVENHLIRIRDKSGRVRHSLTSAEFIDFNQQPCVMATLHDITDRLTSEEKLLQSKKMEAVAQLATGAAHDFNNIMTIIQGHADLLSSTSPLSLTDENSLKAIVGAAQRAANLTRQLLAFCRKQVMQARVINLNEVVTNFTTLPHLLGNSIELSYNFSQNNPFIKADLHMIEEIITNLALNSRDAMPNGGVFRVETSLVRFEQSGPPLPPEIPPGEFACLKVSDTGCGMSPEVKDRIFEPFFTTKEVGKGSGLGLSTVYGNVAQHQGWVEVDSEPDKGTVFRIYLPTTAPVAASAEAPTVTPIERKGTVLVVEDEVILLELVQRLLELYGYRVYTAISGPEALKVWSDHENEIDLLITDMVMPGGMSGHDLAVRLLKQSPSLKVLYTSGYSRDAIEQGFPLQEGVNFLSKPYNLLTMLKLVNNFLAMTKNPVPTLSVVNEE